jgi:hypothetical protein
MGTTHGLPPLLSAVGVAPQRLDVPTFLGNVTACRILSNASTMIFALYPCTTEKLELESILILEPSEPKPTFESLLRVEIVMPACRTHCGRESFPQIALHQLPG